MNYLSLEGGTLYFHGFAKLHDLVSILYTAENSPAIIADGNNRPSATCFSIHDHKCTAPQIIDYFIKKDSINHVFLEIGEKYVQCPLSAK